MSTTGSWAFGLRTLSPIASPVCDSPGVDVAGPTPTGRLVCRLVACPGCGVKTGEKATAWQQARVGSPGLAPLMRVKRRTTTCIGPGFWSGGSWTDVTVPVPGASRLDVVPTVDHVQDGEPWLPMANGGAPATWTP